MRHYSTNGSNNQFFVCLGELSRDRYFPVGTPKVQHGFEGLAHPMRCLEKHAHSWFSSHGFEPGLSVFRPNWWKAEKHELSCLETTRGDGCHDSAGSGNAFDANSRRPSGRHEGPPWIRDERRARVRDEGDRLAGEQPFDEFRRLLAFVVLVEARRASRDGVVLKQSRRPTGIFRRDE